MPARLGSRPGSAFARYCCRDGSTPGTSCAEFTASCAKIAKQLERLQGAILIRGRKAFVLLSGSMFTLWSASADASPTQTRRPCGSSDLTVEVYATGGVIRPDLADSMFQAPARTTTTGAAEQDFTARGSDIGFNSPWMPVIEGGAIVFPCRFFGIGVHGGGSWSGLPDGQAVSPQLAQRTSSQLTMMRMAASLHGQLPISDYFVLRATALIGYRYYSLPVSGTGQREALLQQFSLEPRLEARLRLPVAVPFGVAAYIGGEVISQPALTVGGGLFLATDWPSSIRRKHPPKQSESLTAPPTTPLQSPLEAPVEPPTQPPGATPTPVPLPGPTPIVAPGPIVAPVAPSPVETPPPVVAPVTPSPVETPPVVAPVLAPPVETPPPAAVVNGVAFMDLNGSGLVNVKSDVLNVRGGPSRTAAVVGSLQKGSRVTLTGVAPGWYRIQFGNGVAYVSSDFILREP